MPAPTDGTSEALTVSDAASLMEGLLSARADKKPAATKQPAAEEVADDDEVEGEESDAEAEVEQETEAEEEEQAEGDDEEEAPEAQATQTYKVKVNGQDAEVPLDELLKGYSRTADYTQKTQAHAEKVKAFDSEQTAVRSERAQLAQSLATLAAVLDQATPAEPDWAELQRNDPTEFPIAWATWQQDQKRLASVQQAANKAQQAAQEDSAAQYREHLTAEREKLIEAIPEWSDAKVQTREKDAMKAFAMARGYTEAELAQVSDHRVMVLLRDAMLHEKAVKAKPSIKDKIDAVIVATPGSTQVKKSVVTARAKANTKLAQTGRLDDAAEAMTFLLG